MFKVTGISTLKGITKVRFANDFVSRVKILNKDGHADINLVELPSAISKADCVTYLKGSELYVKFADAINAADHKYNGSATVKVSMDSLKARAEAVETPATEQPAGWTEVEV
jgi:hypothetical protein|tara:strand:- start:112 stop:447 length:336 start_codon:yes stop_codon:yes gene_type:complete